MFNRVAASPVCRISSGGPCALCSGHQVINEGGVYPCGITAPITFVAVQPYYRPWNRNATSAPDSSHKALGFVGRDLFTLDTAACSRAEGNINEGVSWVRDRTAGDDEPLVFITTIWTPSVRFGSGRQNFGGCPFDSAPKPMIILRGYNVKFIHLDPSFLPGLTAPGGPIYSSSGNSTRSSPLKSSMGVGTNTPTAGLTTRRWATMARKILLLPSSASTTISFLL